MLPAYLERFVRLAAALLILGAVITALQGSGAVPSSAPGRDGLPAEAVISQSLTGYAASVGIVVACSLPLALLLGLPAGLRPGSRTDRLLQAPALLLIGLPSFLGFTAMVWLLVLGAGTVPFSTAGAVAAGLIGGGWLARAVRDGLAGARDKGGRLLPMAALLAVAGRILQQTGNLLVIALPLFPHGLPAGRSGPALAQVIMARDLPTAAGIIGGLLAGAAVAHLIGDLLVTAGTPHQRPASRPSAAMLLAGLALFGLLAAGGFATAADPVRVDMASLAQPPSSAYPLGTDRMGRDLLARVASGARLSLTVAAGASLIATVGGGLLGILGGLTGRWGAALLSPRAALPGLLWPVMAVLAGSLLVGPSLAVLTVAIGLAGIPAMAYPFRRVILAPVAPARQGVIRGLLGALLLLFGQCLMAEVLVSFLGLGVLPPAASLGSILAEGQAFLRGAPHMLLPAIPVALGIGGLMLAGHTLTDAAGSEQGG